MSKAPGTEVIGASINTTGTLRVRATKVGSDTVLAQIVEMVQEAQNSKAPGQRLADRTAFWLVFVALIGGSATFLVWWAVGASVPAAGMRWCCADGPEAEAALAALATVIAADRDA